MATVKPDDLTRYATSEGAPFALGELMRRLVPLTDNLHFAFCELLFASRRPTTPTCEIPSSFWKLRRNGQATNMKLNRVPLTFLPRGGVQTLREKLGSRTDRSASRLGANRAPSAGLPAFGSQAPSSALPQSLRPATPGTTDKLKAFLHEKRPSLLGGGNTSSAPDASSQGWIPTPTAVERQAKDSRRADAAYRGAVKGASTVGPLVLKGAVRALGRKLGPFVPAQPIPLAPDLPTMTMPGSFPTGGPPAVEGAAAHLQESGPRQSLPKRVRQHAEDKAADLAFSTATIAGGLFLMGAVTEASRHLPTIAPPVLPEGERPLMHGTFPDSEESVKELLQSPSAAAEKTSLTGKLRQAAQQRQDKLVTRAADMTFRSSVESAKLVGQGAMQALNRQRSATPPLPPSSEMPGAFPEEA